MSAAVNGGMKVYFHEAMLDILGSPEFVVDLEARTGRALAPKQPGRKPAKTAPTGPEAEG